MKSSPPPPDHPLLSLLINIILPVLVLHKGGKFMSAQLTMAVALCFPLIYGVQDYIRRRHKNYVSILGLVNILLTGSLALMSLNGIWFAFKEATLPMVLGGLVLGSSWTENPAARMLFCNPHVLNMADIEDRLSAKDRAQDFQNLLKITTRWLSISFFVSSIANFILAYHIFEDIDPSLSKEQQMSVLNGQLAHMTWMGFGMIAIPLMVFSGTLIYRFLRRLSAMVDLPVEAMMK